MYERSWRNSLSFLGKIFGSQDTIANVVTSGSELLDKAFYTQEEKSEFTGKMADWYLKYQEVTAPQNLARRFIAMMVVGTWTVCVAVAILGFVLSTSWVVPFGEFLFKVVVPPFLLVMYFYFQKRIKE